MFLLVSLILLAIIRLICISEINNPQKSVSKLRHNTTSSRTIVVGLTSLKNRSYLNSPKNQVNQSHEHIEWSLRKAGALWRMSNASAGVTSKHNHMEEQECVAPYCGDGFQVRTPRSTRSAFTSQLLASPTAARLGRRWW